MLDVERVDIERVPVGRLVDRAEASRQEGQVTVIPVYEEVLLCEKRLRLKEELRIRRVSTVHHEPRQVELRREAVEVLRTPAPAKRARYAHCDRPDLCRRATVTRAPTLHEVQTPKDLVVRFLARRSHSARLTAAGVEAGLAARRAVAVLRRACAPAAAQSAE